MMSMDRVKIAGAWGKVVFCFPSYDGWILVLYYDGMEQVKENLTMTQ